MTLGLRAGAAIAAVTLFTFFVPLYLMVTACPSPAGLGSADQLAASSVPPFTVTVYVVCAVAPTAVKSSRASIESH